MFVKLLVDISGTRNGIPWPRHGAVVEIPDDEARSMIVAGLATEASAPVEAAVVNAPVETATVKTEPEAVVVPPVKEPDPEPDPEIKPVRGLTTASMATPTRPMPKG